MLCQIRPHERTLRYHLQPARPHVRQRIGDQAAADAAPFGLFRHDRVREGDGTAVQFIGGERRTGVGRQLEAALATIVGHAHGRKP